MSDIIDVDKLKKYLEDYAQARDWEQFHNPKNIAMALSVEASELVEIFQWLSESQSSKVAQDSELKNKISHELADIITYAVLMGKYLDINIASALENKLQHNAEKYPVDKARGNAKKYSEF